MNLALTQQPKDRPADRFRRDLYLGLKVLLFLSFVVGFACHAASGGVGPPSAPGEKLEGGWG
jgi:hypothetical protein